MAKELAYITIVRAQQPSIRNVLLSYKYWAIETC